MLSYDLGPPTASPLENVSPPPLSFYSLYVYSLPTLICVVGGGLSLVTNHTTAQKLWCSTVHNTHFTTEAMRYNVPAPPIAASLNLKGKLMIYGETREISQFGKKSAKVNHCLYSSTEQLQMAL